MSPLHALVLGVIQGLTEFLPISSSGHLIFLPKFLGWSDQGLAFDVVVHLGTLVAVVGYFRYRLWFIIKSMFGVTSASSSSGKLAFVTPPIARKLGFLILLSTFPAVVVGLLFGGWIESHLRSATVIGVSLIFWGVILGIADVLAKKLENMKTLKQLNDLRWFQALFIGLAQAVALVPGTSRSGITMTAGLFSKLSRRDAAEFSFLMSAPIIALAGAAEVVKLMQNGLGGLSFDVLVIGFGASAVSGLIAIWGLLKIIQRWNFWSFVIYRIVVGILVLALLV